MGLFQDDVWHCKYNEIFVQCLLIPCLEGNCDPRQPAAFFEVKKEGPTKGKWFYTCQSKQCKMFLWKEKAIGRESKVVLSNQRSEAEPFRRPAGAVDVSHITATSVGTKNWIHNLGKKDQRPEEEDDSDEFGVSQEDEQDLITVSKCSVAPTQPSTFPRTTTPETPRKTIKSDQFATPGSKRKRDEQYLPTPQTSDPISPTPRKARLNGGMWDGNERTPFPTPTPRRFREDSAQASTPQSYGISDQVMELLKDQNIDNAIKSKLGGLLATHEMRVSGILKGREAIRMSLKKRDETIEELKQRISALEVDQGMDKSIIKYLKDSLGTSIITKKS